MKKRRDLILILTILIISLVAIIVLKVSSKKNNLKAIVYYKNDIVLEIDLAKLDDDITYYKVNGDNGDVVIACKHNKIAVVEENSTYHLCSKQGYISSTNESIVCLPNKVYIKLVGEKSKVDVEI